MTPPERRQLILGLTLICHSSLRGVVELLADVFHALQTVQSLVTLLENRAYGAIAAAADLQRKQARLQWQGRPTHGVAVKLGHAKREEARAVLQSQLGGRYFSLRAAAAEVASQTVRASSLVENLNSRLRNYFFLRRHLGPDYLALLQFFLNHRRFSAERAARAGRQKSGGTAQRQPPCPLAGDARLRPLLS